MFSIRVFFRALLVLIFGCSCSFALVTSAEPFRTPSLTFEEQIRPIFKTYCLEWHGGTEKPKGKLDLRLRRFALKGGSEGPTLVPGKPGESNLLKRMLAGEMPPGKTKVPPEKIALIERWIAAGAPTRKEEPQSLPPGLGVTAEERAYWFYQPLHRPEPPPGNGDGRVRTPIDAFVLARLRQKGLTFNPDADRLTLLRRAALDLTGLPPTPKEIEEFLSDPSEQTYERWLDRLLASPAYGERWGRHWLDVAGYADSDGDGTSDTIRPHAYKYRDYIIRSFNNDKPLNRLIVEQVAGDELVPNPIPSPMQPDQIDRLTATGFLRLAPDSTGSSTTPADREQVLTDTLKIISSSLLGLTVGCAQCHDHRYDPISQEDYYRLRAIFEPALDPAHWRQPAQRRISLLTEADRAKSAAIDAEANRQQQELDALQKKHVEAALERELMKFPTDQRDRLRTAFQTPEAKRTPEQKQLVATNPKLNINPGVLYQYDQPAADMLKAMQAKIAARRAEKPVEDFLAVLNEIPGQVPPTRIHHRGDYRQPLNEVQPGDLTIAAEDGHRLEIPSRDPKLTTTGRRLAYARHLTSGNHPLLGRVLVNRIWHHHFGRGIVETPGDFGILGGRPSHPDLLDWLATELVRQGWSLKQLHRLIMTSTVYRQSSTRTPSQDAVDSGNTLLGRYPIHRLEAESLRDRILFTSGHLDRTPFGPAVPGVEDVVGQVQSPNDRPRRSIYLQARRSKPIAFLTTFDAPSGEVNCERRIISTVATQALMLMNNDFILHEAGRFAQRLRKETPPDFALEQTLSIRNRYPRRTDAWSYGHGDYDAKTARVIGFSHLPHWTGSSWQGGPSLPDPTIGWVMMTPSGGHPWHGPRGTSIRRWTSPGQGTLQIQARLKHGSPNGDGVRGRIVSSRSGLVGEWTVKNKELATPCSPIEVQLGDTIDFVVDCLASDTSDSYEWPIQLTLTTPPATANRTWNSTTDFRGPKTPSLPQMISQAWLLAYQRQASHDELELACGFVARQLDQIQAADAELVALTNLCQQLLASNEFLYVD